MLSIVLFIMIGVIIEAPIWYWITLGVFCVVRVCLLIFGEVIKSIGKAVREHFD